MKLRKLLVLVLVFLMMGFSPPKKYPLPLKPPFSTCEIELSLETFPYSTENISTFAAQVFNYPITQANFEAYLTDFHYDTTRITISGFDIKDFTLTSIKSIRTVLANKTYKKEGNVLTMQIQNNEVVCFTIKYKD